MTLDSIKAIPFINQTVDYLGCDNPDSPGLKQIYNNDLTDYFNYPYKVNYKFNSRGFRDNEWPNNLNDRVWCIGDSAVINLSH